MGKTPVVNREHCVIHLEVFNDMYWLQLMYLSGSPEVGYIAIGY